MMRTLKIGSVMVGAGLWGSLIVLVASFLAWWLIWGFSTPPWPYLTTAAGILLLTMGTVPGFVLLPGLTAKTPGQRQYRMKVALAMSPFIWFVWTLPVLLIIAIIVRNYPGIEYQYRQIAFSEGVFQFRGIAPYPHTVRLFLARATVVTFPLWGPILASVSSLWMLRLIPLPHKPAKQSTDT